MSKLSRQPFITITLSRLHAEVTFKAIHCALSRAQLRDEDVHAGLLEEVAAEIWAAATEEDKK